MPFRLHKFRQLFFDDCIIHEKYNVHRTINQPIKHPEPVLKPERGWEENGSGVFGTVLYDADEEIYKMWYTARCKELGLSICYATSKDGVRWIKPNLGICVYKGSRDNNIVLSQEQTGGRVFIPSIIKKDGKYVMYFWRHSPVLLGEATHAAPSWEIALHWYCRAASKDGIHWTLTETPPYCIAS